MQVKDAMTESCEFIKPDASLKEAALKMRDLDCGFLPIGNEERGKLEGVITDRDLVIRAVAEGADPDRTEVQNTETHRVLYCFENDDLESAAQHMRGQQVYRLVVLDNPESKQLCGVITLGDILRHHENQLAANAAEGIASRATH